MKIGQYVEVPVNATETVVGPVKTRYYDAQRRVLLAVETSQGMVTAYEWYAKTAEDPYAADRAEQKARNEAEQAAKARKAAEEATATRLQDAAEGAAAKQKDRECRDLERAARSTAKQAAKQAKADHKAAEREAAALRERAIAAEAQATVDAPSLVARCWGRPAPCSATQPRRAPATSTSAPTTPLAP